MARIRTIKPTFWDHEQLGRASTLARLTFAGLISQADDQGRGRADSDWLWGRLHPYAPPALKATWKRTLSELGALKDDDGPLVVFYKVANSSYYWLPGFCNQQYIEKPSESAFPAPPNSGSVPLPVGDRSAQEGKGREGKGGEGKAPPPSSASPGTPEPDSHDPRARGPEGAAPGSPLGRPPAAKVLPAPPRDGSEVDLDALVALARRLDPSLPAETIKREVRRAERAGVGLPRLFEDVKKLGDRLKIWAIVDNYEHPSAKGKNGAAGEVRTNQNPTGYIPPVLADPGNLIQERQKAASAKADQYLRELDPEELKTWATDAHLEADQKRIPASLRDDFIKSLLRKRVATAFSIEGL